MTSRWVTARSYFRFRSSLLFPSLRGSMRLLRFARSDKVKGSLRGRSVFSEAVSFFNESRSAKRNPKVTVAPTLLASSLFHPLTQHRYGRFWGSPKHEGKPSVTFLYPSPRPRGLQLPQEFFTTHSKRIKLYSTNPALYGPPIRYFLSKASGVPKDGMAVIPMKYRE